MLKVIVDRVIKPQSQVAQVGSAQLPMIQGESVGIEILQKDSVSCYNETS